MAAAKEWIPSRHGVDRADFSQGQLGPYQLGRSVRTTQVGEVVLALHDSDPHIVELELLDPLRLTTFEPKLLHDVNHVMGLRHRHICTVLGAGVHDSLIYLAREHRLGRPLDQVMDLAPGDMDVAVGVAYSVAEVLVYLADEGPHPGACAFGGFDARDVILGFDGAVGMVGLGLKSLRQPDDPRADLNGLVDLMRALDRWVGGGLEALVDPLQGGLPELTRRLRTTYREACGLRREHLGAFLRSLFSDSIRNERAFFGLDTLH